MKVLISTGGTGGHIYPALSLAKYLKEDDQDCEILFVGTSNHMEAQIIQEAEYNFIGIEAAGLIGSPWKKLMALKTTFFSIFKCQTIIDEFQPDVIVTFGGYVTVPVGIAAHRRKVPLLVHEQNSYLGKANRALMKYAENVVVCYDNVLAQVTENKGLNFGNPRATEAADLPIKHGLLNELNLSNKKKTVLIVMGSQGSETINKIIVNTLPKLVNKSYQTIFVTGKKHYEEIKLQTISSDNIRVVDYIDQMSYLKVVDLIIARGGATTAAEIAVSSVPSIIIPSPYVPNNHQYLNAVELETLGASRIIEEVNMSESVLMAAIDSIINFPENHIKMKNATVCFAKPNAAHDFIRLIKEVVNGKSSV